MRRCWRRSVSAETREQLIGRDEGIFRRVRAGQRLGGAVRAQCCGGENGFAATNNADGPAPDKAQASFHMFSEGCAGEIDRGYFPWLEKVRDARPLVVDEKQGLVLDLAFFDNQGDVKSVAVDRSRQCDGACGVSPRVQFHGAAAFQDRGRENPGDRGRKLGGAVRNASGGVVGLARTRSLRPGRACQTKIELRHPEGRTLYGT